MKIEKYTIGVGDRFAHQAKAQLHAFQLAAAQGADIVPVWNKSNREHLIVGSEPSSVQEAAAMGFVAEVVPAAELMAAARRWADEILECSPASIAATKAVVQSLDGHSVEHSMKDMFHLPEVRSRLTGPDMREGIQAFAEKRKPNWTTPG